MPHNKETPSKKRARDSPPPVTPPTQSVVRRQEQERIDNTTPPTTSFFSGTAGTNRSPFDEYVAPPRRSGVLAPSETSGTSSRKLTFNEPPRPKSKKSKKKPKKE